MAKTFAKAASFCAVLILAPGFDHAVAWDWSAEISDAELATANTPPAASFIVSSPFQLQRFDLAPQSIQVTALDTGVDSTTQAMVSLSLRLHVTYP
jgi:hypothetical protein